jgi:transcription antitermination factor NusG
MPGQIVQIGDAPPHDARNIPQEMPVSDRPQNDYSAAWFVAKTSGRECHARFYLGRAGIEFALPQVHRFFVDKRTGVEKFRASPIFPGYIFFRPRSRAEVDRVARVLGVAYVLGCWEGERFTPSPMPEGWVDRLIEAGPIIEGKRKKFCNGDHVRVIIGGIYEIIATVVLHKRGKVIVHAQMFGSDMNFEAQESHVEVMV